MKTWQCIVCGFIYDEAKGLPEDGIAPGTVWADVPENWECPDCGVEVFVYPTEYEDNGIPFCAECDCYMVYNHTEMLS